MRPGTPINIVFADNHDSFRHGFHSLFKAEDGINLIGTAPNGQELIELTDEKKPDVIVTDIRMPVLTGIEATKIIVQRFPTIPVLALSVCEDMYIMAMLEAGAKGFVDKDAPTEELIEGIITVYNGGHYLCSIASKSFKQYNLQRVDVTEREKEVIRLMARQLSNKEIGIALNLSEETIKYHRKNIYFKLGATNMVGVIRWAEKNGLVE